MAEINITDPDNVAEVFCDGVFTVQLVGTFAVLTFTHERPDANRLFSSGEVTNVQSVVRARVALRTENLHALRDTLNRLLTPPDSGEGTAPAGAAPH